MLFDGQCVGSGGRGRFLQERMQPAEQRFHFLWIENRRRDQQRRCTGRDQRRIGFEGGLQCVSRQVF
jgi:hypothetical protein